MGESRSGGESRGGGSSGLRKRTSYAARESRTSGESRSNSSAPRGARAKLPSAESYGELASTRSYGDIDALTEDIGGLDHNAKNYMQRRTYLAERLNSMVKSAAERGNYEEVQKLGELGSRLHDDDRHGLGGKLGVILLAGVGIFFVGSSFTGHAISNLTSKSSSFLGTGVLLVALISGFLLLKNHKQK